MPLSSMYSENLYMNRTSQRVLNDLQRNRLSRRPMILLFLRHFPSSTFSKLNLGHIGRLRSGKDLAKCGRDLTKCGLDLAKCG
jgi:hypothetical protein